MENSAQLVYYAIVIAFAITSAQMGAVMWLSKRIDATNRVISEQVAARTNILDGVRGNSDLKFSEASKRDAELSERITAMRYEAFKELGAYVTRVEFDKRMEKLENGQFLQNSKLDMILERLSSRGIK